MRAAIAAYVQWYNTARPHTALNGATPAEVRDNITPARTKRAFEVRDKYPLRRRQTGGKPPTKRLRGSLELAVSSIDGHRQLPLLELREAA